MAFEPKALSPIDPKDMVCWAIDAGTARSGACFTLPKQPDRFFSGLPSKDQVVKIPTDILIDRHTKKLVAFGEEAIQRYHGEGEEGEAKYALFEKFKMQLYRENKLLKERPTVKSVCGTVEISAVDAFGYVFEFFHKCAEEILSTNAKSHRMSDIQWVITVPAIWSDGAKQIMIEAAKKGRLADDDSRITVCLEPTAASMWAFHTLNTEDAAMCVPGTKCLTVDAGGGTIDIMLFEVLEKQMIKKLAPESGGGWGSTYIDKEFEMMLDDVFGKDPMDDFRRSQPSDFHKMMSEFESVKVLLTPEDVKDSTRTFAFTLSELTDFLEEKYNIDAAEKLKERGAAYSLTYSRKKLRLPSQILLRFFQKQTNYIVDHVKKLLSGHKDVKFIYMVGGFSSSNLLFDAIKSEFEDSKKYGAVRVVRPPQPGEAIVMGAALYARNTAVVTNIIKDVSYGVRIIDFFDAKKHDISQKFVDSTGDVCARNCFAVFFRKGECYNVDYSPSRIFHPSEPRMTTISFPVFISNSENPVHTTEPGCKQLGSVTLSIPIPSSMESASNKELLDRDVKVEFVFMGEILRVKATYSLTKASHFVDIKCLE